MPNLSDAEATVFRPQAPVVFTDSRRSLSFDQSSRFETSVPQMRSDPLPGDVSLARLLPAPTSLSLFQPCVPCRFVFANIVPVKTMVTIKRLRFQEPKMWRANLP